MIILGTNSIKDTGYDVANSLRFNQPDNPYLTRTISSAGSTTTISISFWFKRGKLTDDLHLFSSNSFDEIKITGSDTLRIESYTGGYNYRKITNRLFRDPSATYHMLVVFDTSNSTANDRIRIYINGSRETSFSTSQNPSQNFAMSYFGTSHPFIIGTDARTLTGASNLDGYLSEVVALDGSALDPTSFGEFDEDSGIWKPIDVSGLTFGTNGFYLDFEDSSALGDDVSGNSNDFTVNNLTATDQSTDTCTNNFATLNALLPLHSSTFTEGNLKWTPSTASQYYWSNSTFGLSQGKWYVEAKLTTAASHNVIGIASDQPEDSSTFLAGSGGSGDSNDAFQYGYKSSNGQVYNDTTGSSYGNTYTTNDIIGFYLDLDNNKLYFAKNGTIQNSGTGVSITDPASSTTGVYFFAVADGTSGNSSVWEVNFGSPTYTIVSGNADANGYGNFEYSPNDSGGSSFDSTAKNFYALNTKNLAEFG